MLVLLALTACGPGIIDLGAPETFTTVTDTGSTDTGSTDTGSTDTGEEPDDLDGDGYPLTEDCDDTNSEVNPGMMEVPYNGVDDDCDLSTVDDDLDGDGYPLAGDCDDTNSEVNPGMMEACYNEVDDNCDGGVDDMEECDYLPCDASSFGVVVGRGYARNLKEVFHYDRTSSSSSAYKDDLSYRGCGDIVSQECYDLTLDGSFLGVLHPSVALDSSAWVYAPFDLSSVHDGFQSFWCTMSVMANVDGEVLKDSATYTVYVY